MKIVYTWLKDFVDVKATPDELASRLALSGTNIGASRMAARRGHRRRSFLQSPDCLGHYGIAREVGAVYKLPLKPVSAKPHESTAAKASDAVRVEIQSPEFCGRFTARVIRGVKIQPSPKMAQGPPRSFRRSQHQQRRRREQLRDARTRACAPRLRLRTKCVTIALCPPRQAIRKNPDPRRHRTYARHRHLHDLRCEAPGRASRHHGRRRNRNSFSTKNV